MFILKCFIIYIYAKLASLHTILFIVSLYTIQGVSEKNEQILNCSQRREAAQSMKFLINIDCLGTYDVE